MILAFLANVFRAHRYYVCMDTRDTNFNELAQLIRALIFVVGVHKVYGLNLLGGSNFLGQPSREARVLLDPCGRGVLHWS